MSNEVDRKTTTPKELDSALVVCHIVVLNLYLQQFREKFKKPNSMDIEKITKIKFTISHHLNEIHRKPTTQKELESAYLVGYIMVSSLYLHFSRENSNNPISYCLK